MPAAGVQMHLRRHTRILERQIIENAALDVRRMVIFRLD
jgi:hypothetical protein